MFEDLVVVELASVLAGPAVGIFFAELGARVIKIENRRTGGDVTRGWRIKGENRAISAYYSAVNWNKESLMLDLSQATDLEQTLELIKSADIVIANYKPGDAEKLGVDYESLKAHHPSLIYATLKGFSNDPERVAYDVVLQAETGFLFMNGTPTSGPVKMPVALIDLLAAHQLKEAILIGLLKKAKTGEGSFIETSLEEAALASLANQATNWLMNGYDPQPLGTIHPNIAPYGEVFSSADDQLFVLAVGAENQFRSLCEFLGLNGLPGDPRFSTNVSRVQHRTELASLLADAFSTLSYGQIASGLGKYRIPFGKIRSVKEVMEGPTAQSMLLRETIEGVQTVRLRSVAFNKFW
ncbi:MAG: CaiB/BaiF CoA-transferase family protein [Bacteroidota bacterium]